VGVVRHKLPVISGKSQERLELFLVLGSQVGEQCLNLLLTRLDPTEADVVAKVIEVGCRELTLGRTQSEVGVPHARQYRTKVISVGLPRLAKVDNVVQVRAGEVARPRSSLTTILEKVAGAFRSPNGM